MTALEAKSIHKSYAKYVALNDVSISVEQGTIFGLLGPNGAGKTSLIRIINQITGPDAGEVMLFGERLNQSHIAQIGYLPEERGLYKKMKVGEQALYLAQLKGLSKQEAKHRLDKWFKRLEIDGWWNKKVEELSKGMAQKIQFVTTVLHEPKLLILDEPFSGFDPINANLIKGEIMRLKEEGTTIILSTHNMGSVEEICDNIALINKSRVVLEGSVKDVREKFHKNEYLVRFDGNMIAFATALWSGFELLHKNEDGEAIVKLGEGKTVNDLLRSITESVEVKEVMAHIPTMQEVFIQAVQQATPQP
jgi:ABC-2 type transport system ATP-binding protein